jgi:hypothetical protein
MVPFQIEGLLSANMNSLVFFLQLKTRLQVTLAAIIEPTSYSIFSALSRCDQFIYDIVLRVRSNGFDFEHQGAKHEIGQTPQFI